jgi:hypothetical protein
MIRLEYNILIDTIIKKDGLMIRYIKLMRISLDVNDNNKTNFEYVFRTNLLIITCINNCEY